MDIDIEQLVSGLVAVAGLASAFFVNQRYQTIKAQLLETVGDLADFLALVYAAAKGGTCNDPETVKKIISKTEEIWTDLEALGPSVAALLAQKSSLAEAIKNTADSEAKTP
ncbi:MAG: hypothetical protein AB9879_09720 [Methanothrix sp.]